MAAITDARNQPLSAEQIAGLRRFTESGRRPPARLVVFFEIDDAYQAAHPDEADIYGAFLPAPLSDVAYLPLEGELLTCSKQWQEGAAALHKQFQVVRVGTQIEQTSRACRVCIIVAVVPVERVGLLNRRMYV